MLKFILVKEIEDKRISKSLNIHINKIDQKSPLTQEEWHKLIFPCCNNGDVKVLEFVLENIDTFPLKTPENQGVFEIIIEFDVKYPNHTTFLLQLLLRIFLFSWWRLKRKSRAGDLLSLVLRKEPE